MNRYTVNSLIGEGSFGRVYKATRKDDVQTVAIKIISKVNKNLYLVICMLLTLVVLILLAGQIKP